MPSVIANVQPDLLRWARTTSGYDRAQAARRLKVAEERLAAWESDDDDVRPTVPQLRKIAGVYKRPLAAFYLAERPRGFDVMRDFRRLADTDIERSWSPALHTAYHRALREQAIVEELLNDTDELEPPGAPQVSLDDDPESVGLIARRWLGVTMAEQSSWRTANDALNGWVRAVDAAGILVLQTISQSEPIELAEMRGFSITSGVIPVIVLNSDDPHRGRIFTLGHEVIHVMLRGGGLCDLDERGDEVEVFCNAAAAALLMPRQELLNQPLVAPVREPKEWTLDELDALSRMFGTSQEAVLRRLTTIDRATREFYLQMRGELLDRYEEHRRSRLRSSGGPDWDVMRVRDLGRRYVQVVTDAYARDAIGLSTVSDFLGTKVKHIDAIRERANR